MEQNPVVFEARGLSKSFGSRSALKNINLTLYRGKIVGLLGPNGSGKTTLMKLTAGLIQPDAGEIHINGKPIGVESKLMQHCHAQRESAAGKYHGSHIRKIFSEKAQNRAKAHHGSCRYQENSYPREFSAVALAVIDKSRARKDGHCA